KRELDLGQGWVDRLQVGDLLLDPTNITIQAGTVSGIGGSPVTTNTLGAVDIANFLNNTGSLTITTASGGADPGDITVNAGVAIAWNTSNSLTLRADRSINLNPGSSITSTSGDITLIALGQVAGNLNGVNIFGATVESTSGNITMTGRAPDGGDGGWQAGVMIRGDGTTANPALVKSSTGTIILEGTGGNGGGADVGLMVWGASGASALVESQDGSISLTGTGPGGVNFLKHGLYLANGAVRTTGTGNINFAGTPGYPGTYNGGYGLYFDSTSLVEATGSGNITLNSFRDIYINTTTFNLGTGNFTLDATNPILSTLPTTIQFYNSTAQTSGAGSITFDTLQQANIQTSTLRVQDGDITISGNQGTSITPGGYTGVYLAAATLEATGVGNILLQGRTGDSTGNINGVHLNTGSLVKSISGDITLLGQAVGANASATGVLLDYGSAIETQTGAVTLTGSNNGSGASGTGIGMGNGSQIRSTGIGAAAITLDGQMASPASSGRGVVLAHGGTGIFTVDGNVQVTGIGQNWFDVDLDQGVTIRSTGLGNILVQSSNANNSGTSIILYFGANALTATGSGSITVDAARNIDLQGANLSTNTGDLTLRANTAGTATGNFTGLSLNNTQLSSTSGTIALTGQGGETGDNNNGIFVTNTSTIAAPIVSLTGTGGVGGLGNNGIRVSGAGTNILSAGAITLNGTGGSGTLASGSGSGVAANNGLALESSALIEATGTGTITLEGVGGNGVD
ncbi:MAG: beta strand repeat-containing protein, partial [Prochlorotrichaceae cyanobacterium]